MNRTIEPDRPFAELIRVPEDLVDSIDQLVERQCRRSGERPHRLRRAIEIEVLRRGIESLRGELSP